MTRAAVVLVLVAGCNQIFGLEAGSGAGNDGGGDDGDGGPDHDGTPAIDAPDDGRPACTTTSTADEDFDGVPDDCDGCPHRADSVPLDQDGDGVNDACDPDPGQVNHIVFFDGFNQPSLPGWIASGPTWGQVQGGFVAQTDHGLESAYFLRDDVVPPRAFIDTGVVVDSFADVTNDRERGIGVFFHATTVSVNGAPDSIECQYHTDISTNVSAVELSRWTNGVEVPLTAAPATTLLEENGRYDVAVSVDELLVTCTGGFDNGGVSGTTVAPAETPRGTALALHARYVAARWAYVIVIDRP